MDVSGFPAPQVLVERLVPGLDVLAVDERAGEVGPRDDAARGLARHLGHLKRHAEGSQTLEDFDVPGVAARPGLQEHHVQGRVVGIDEVSQDVAGPFVELRRDLDAGDDLNPKLATGSQGFGRAGGRVVIGHGNRLESRLLRLAHDLSRRERPVARAGVNVEVHEVGLRHLAGHRVPFRKTVPHIQNSV